MSPAFWATAAVAVAACAATLPHVEDPYLRALAVFYVCLGVGLAGTLDVLRGRR